MQRLDAIVAAQAIYSELGKRLKTNDPTNARGELDRHFGRLRKESGARSFDLTINGQEVGTYSFPKRKEKTALKLSIDDPKAYRCWCEENGLLELPALQSVWQWVQDTGELPEGATLTETTEGGNTAERGTLRVDFSKVRAALDGDFSPALEGMDTMRLEEGE